MATLEQRIAVLENENRARKASYQTAGGKVPFIMQTSGTWHKVGNNNTPVIVRVRFTPDKVSPDGVSLTTLSSQVAYDSTFVHPTEDATSFNEPQSGDGSVTLNLLIAHVPFSNTDYYVRVVAVGPSLGNFTLL